MDNAVIVHFHSKYSNYFDLNIWQWQEGKLGEEACFLRFDSFGVVANLTFPADYFVGQAFFLVKNRDWSKKSLEYTINRPYGVPKSEVWVVDGDPLVYHSRQAAVASLHYASRHVHAFDMATNSKMFDKKWGFTGWLGYQYSEEKTDFRLWAPTAERVELILYASTDDKASVEQVIPMVRGEHVNPDNHAENTIGLWEISLLGDYNYQAYRYRVYYRKRTFRHTRDPYSIATTADGRRSVIIAEKDRQPEGFKVSHGKDAKWRLANPNQSVILELHVRDFSKSETSGVSLDKRGKFLGMIEEGTTNANGDATGFDYIKSLGVSHIQLQPIFDHHQTFDDNGDYAYNWGYDPENYNVPEASFSSNPHNPVARILELKQVIQAYHDAGIGVIMDVVYNHTYSNKDSAFQLAVPDYYYRMNPDGSFQNGTGVGNETASEKEMFRKYMIDSIVYWVEEYNIDGFRFDLMGIHDVETMNLIRQRLDEIDPRILMYGEGWDMGTGLSPEQKAKKGNAYQMPRIGFFNDDQRNAVKGAEVYGHFDRGFVSGQDTEDKVAKSILGSDELSYYLSPNQVVNYVEAHDNYNLNDLLWELHPEDSEEEHIKRVELATGINLLAQGICFMQLGQEFFRTKRFATGEDGELTHDDKERAMNSYNAPDSVNQVDWDLVTKYRSSIERIKRLIRLKRFDPAFSYDSFEKIRQHVFITEGTPGTGAVSFEITDGNTYTITFNKNEKNIIINMT